MKVLKGIAIAFTVVVLLVTLVCHLLMPFDLPGDVLLIYSKRHIRDAQTVAI